MKRKTSLVLVAVLILTAMLGLPGEVSAVAEWSVFVGGDGSLNRPREVAVDDVGNVYVADTSNHRILKFDKTALLLATWGGLGSEDGQFNGPWGVAVGADGCIYVADTGNHRIQKLRPDGSWQATWGGLVSGSGDAQFSSPKAVAVDSKGSIYVTDEGNDRIKKLNQDGSLAATWGAPYLNGDDPGQFNDPIGIAIDSDDNVYVADYRKKRIQKLTSDETWSILVSGMWAAGVEVDGVGNIYVSHDSKLSQYSSSGSLSAEWISTGTEPGQFRYPAGLAVDLESGRLYVADSNNDRIQVLSEGPTDEEAVQTDTDALVAADFDFSGEETAAAVTQDFALPDAGDSGTTIIWTEKEDEGNNISISGNVVSVIRPALADVDKTVVLTATVSRNSVNQTKDLSVTIKAYTEAEYYAVDYQITRNSDVYQVDGAGSYTFSQALAACIDAGSEGNLVIQLGSEGEPLQIAGVSAGNQLKSATYIGNVVMQRADPTPVGFLVPSAAMVHLRNLNISYGGAAAHLTLTSIRNQGTLYLETGTEIRTTYPGYNTVVPSVINEAGAELHIDGATLVSRDNIVTQNHGTLEMTAGRVEVDEASSTPQTALASYGGVVTVSGGTIKANKIAIDAWTNSEHTLNISGGEIITSGSSSESRAIRIYTNLANAISLSITGGKVEAGNSSENSDAQAVYVHRYQAAPISIDISGGELVSRGAGTGSYALYAGQSALLSISGDATVIGARTAVQFSGTDLNISGGIVESTHVPGVDETNPGTALLIANSTQGAVNMTGGELRSVSDHTVKMDKIFNPMWVPDPNRDKAKFVIGGKEIFGRYDLADVIITGEPDAGKNVLTEANCESANLTTYDTTEDNVFLSWTSNSARSNHLSVDNPASLASLTTGSNAGVNEIYLNTGAMPAAPNGPTLTSFTDTDRDAGQIGGTMSWSVPADASGVLGYRVYWGIDSTTKHSLVFTAPGTANTSQAVSQNTGVPAGVTHFLVHSYGLGGGESVLAAAVLIVDDQTNLEITDGANDLDVTDFTYAIGEDADGVKSSFTLPLTGSNGTDISWEEQDDPGNVAVVNGSMVTVRRPSNATGDQMVVLTATISKGSGDSVTKNLTIVMLATTPEEEAADSADIQAAIDALTAMSFGYQEGEASDNVKTSFSLPLTGELGTTVAWTETVDTNYISLSQETGVVTATRPAHDEGEQIITLTATVSKGNGTAQNKNLTVTVTAYTQAEEADIDIAAALAALDESDFGYVPGENNANVRSDFGLPLNGSHGTSIAWEEKIDLADNVVINQGTGEVTVTRPSSVAGDKTLVLTATIGKEHGTSLTKDLSVVVKAYTVAEEAGIDINAAAANLDQADFTYAEGESGTDVKNNFTLPLLGTHGTSISWVEKTDLGNSVVINGTTGAVTVIRPLSTIGNQNVTLTATVSKAPGVAVTQDLSVVVIATTLVEEQANAAISADYAALDEADFAYAQGENKDNVKTSLTLPQNGQNSTTISWVEQTDAGNNINIELATGTVTVTRPSSAEGDKTVILTATISKQHGTAMTKGFVVTVKAYTSAEEADMDIAGAVAALDEADFSYAQGENCANVKTSFTLPQSGENSTTIGWAEKTDGGSNISLDPVTGAVTVTRPTFADGDKTVVLIATVSKEHGTNVTKDLTVTVRAFTQAEEANRDIAATDGTLNVADFTYAQGEDSTNVKSSFALPGTGSNDTNLAWGEKTDSGHNISINTATGVVTVIRPSFADGDKTVVLIATISKENGTSVTKDLTVMVKAYTQAEEADMDIAGAVAALDETDFTYVADEDKDNVKSSLTLPLNGENSTTITWVEKTDTGNCISLDPVTGVVTVSRPSSAAGDATVTLTATVSKEHGTDVTKDSTVTVKAYTLAEEADMVIATAVAALNETDITYAPEENSADVRSSFTLPLTGENGVVISWSEQSDAANNVVINNATGVVTVSRPSSYVGDKMVVLTATVSKEPGTSVTKDLTVVVKARPRIIDEDDNTPVRPTDPKTIGVDILVNGQAETAATATTTDEGETSVTTITMDGEKVEERLRAEGKNAIVTISVNNDSDVLVRQLTGQTVKQMETKAATLEIATAQASYTLPAAEISIEAVVAELGEGVSLQDITVQVQIARPSDGTVELVTDAVQQGNYLLVVPPVEFSISCTYGEQTVSVSRFNAYVERTIAIPEGVDPAKVTTAVVLRPDGTFQHVPTRVTVIDGKYFAEVNSLSNSTYSVIWNEVEFADLAGHWAKGPVTDMASRLVMEGESDTNFGPGTAITRGEFAETIVKALGLKLEAYDGRFKDVQADHRCADYVATANTYGVMGGYTDDTFRPESKITRQEAMAMVTRAMLLTGLDSGLSSRETAVLLEAYADGGQVSGWARNVVAECLQSGIIGGKSNRQIAPLDHITRAETAAIMQRLLRKSGLI